MSEGVRQSPLYQRNFLVMNDLSPEELALILSRAADLKARLKHGRPHRLLEGQTLAMIFEKQSTRTRVSFEAGMFQLGGHALYLSKNDIQMGRGESIEDTAKVLSGMVNCILARTYAHSTVTELANHARVPVINALTDYEHPCQILADLLTIQEEKGKLEGLKLAYIGDGNNVANSLMAGCAMSGLNISLACPDGYGPDAELLSWAQAEAGRRGRRVEVIPDPSRAAEGADVLYTDVWVSMGQEEETAKRGKAFQGYQINSNLAALAKKDCIVLHDLPAHYGEEITKDLAYGPKSRIFQQAENRLHAQKALLSLVLSKESQEV